MTKGILCVLMLFAFSSARADEAAVKADAQAVDSACTADASKAGCGNEKVGTGLMKCLHAYKEAHKDFKISDGCHDSMRKMHEAKKDENDSVSKACAADGATAQCGDKKVGSGLLKCIHAYKEAHKDFKVSDSCKAAMHEMHGEKAGK